jgi:hypothetical protein
MSTTDWKETGLQALSRSFVANISFKGFTWNWLCLSKFQFRIHALQCKKMAKSTPCSNPWGLVLLNVANRIVNG